MIALMRQDRIINDMPWESTQATRCLSATGPLDAEEREETVYRVAESTSFRVSAQNPPLLQFLYIFVI